MCWWWFRCLKKKISHKICYWVPSPETRHNRQLFFASTVENFVPRIIVNLDHTWREIFLPASQRYNTTALQWRFLNVQTTTSALERFFLDCQSQLRRFVRESSIQRKMQSGQYNAMREWLVRISFNYVVSLVILFVGLLLLGPPCSTHKGGGGHDRMYTQVYHTASPSLEERSFNGRYLISPKGTSPSGDLAVKVAMTTSF